MTLSTLAILIGVLYCIPAAFALANPAGASRSLRQFPRSESWGYALMTIGAAWFLYNLNRETIADFAAYKRIMLLGFGALAVLTCIFVRDFLAVRGLSIVLLMLAWFTLNHTRWAESQWRLVLVVLAYLWVLAGMVFTVSPYLLRDVIHWKTETTSRLRLSGGARFGLGIFLIILGLTAFRK